MKYALCVKLYQHDFTKVIVIKLLVNSVNRVVEFPGAGLGRLITINSELNGAI